MLRHLLAVALAIIPAALRAEGADKAAPARTSNLAIVDEQPIDDAAAIALFDEVGAREQRAAVAEAEYAGDAEAAEPIEPLPEMIGEESRNEIGDQYVVSSDESADTIACGDVVDDWGLDWRWLRPLSTGWTVTPEVSALWPSFSRSSITLADAGAAVAPRVSLGWENPDGLGIRARGWGINDSPHFTRTMNSTDATVLADTFNYSAARLDLDIYRRFKYRRGELTVGASVTTAYFDQEDQLSLQLQQQTSYYNSYSYYYYGYYSNQPYTYYPQYGYDSRIATSEVSPQQVQTITSRTRNVGAGLGLLLEAKHHLYESDLTKLSIFGRGRFAQLVGEWKRPTAESSPQRGNANIGITETALGIEYRRSYRYADAFLQCSAEFQFWDLPQLGKFDFGGVTTGAGLNW